MPSPTIEIKIHNGMHEIPIDMWNGLLADNNPFLRHEFLSSLETHQCVSQKFGWIPRHLALYQENSLIAAMPLYEKHNNYGEFVFDQAWSDAWKQVGLNYYPKLVSAIPYSPVLGQRMLIDPDLSETERNRIKTHLIKALQGICQNNQISGAHILFSDQKQQNWLAQQPQWLHRQDCQFHWFNQNYQTFDDFLATLTAKKRKNIRQERAAVKRSGITFRVLDGHSATQQDWQNFDRFYQKTFHDKWGTPTLNQAFFQSVAKQLPESIVLILAYQPLAKIENSDNPTLKCIAGALMFQSNTHLYGRHWGCIEAVKNLHFEACFYQGIEHAIKKGLQVFEPGAGGEHKIARGFVPVVMHSSHWLTENPFTEAIDRFIAEEAQGVQSYITDCLKHTPYKDTDAFYDNNGQAHLHPDYTPQQTLNKSSTKPIIAL